MLRINMSHIDQVAANKWIARRAGKILRPTRSTDQNEIIGCMGADDIHPGLSPLLPSRPVIWVDWLVIQFVDHIGNIGVSGSYIIPKGACGCIHLAIVVVPNIVPVNDAINLLADTVLDRRIEMVVE